MFASADLLLTERKPGRLHHSVTERRGPVGLAVASVVTRALNSLLVGVNARDAITLTSVTALLLLAGVLGCLVPARTAIGVDPASALRSD
jgi:branched-subunit amino acid ABC-type transport system permease component